jgi:hypothetical protein
MTRKLVLISLICTASYFMTACKKDPGTGGSSSISGKVYVKDYNSTFTVLQDEYYGQEIDVYILYGDEKSVGDRVRTSYDGTFEFKYLRKGIYHVFAYSKDSTLQTNAMIPIIKDIEITKNGEVIETPQITVLY